MAEGSRWDVGNHDGFLACYDATRLEVFRYASRLTGDRQLAEDLVHDIYVETLRRARSGQLEPIGVGWLCRAVRHRHLDWLRGTERERRRLRLVGTDTTPDDDETDAVTDGLLDGLSVRERAAVVLRHIDGLSVREVADQLGTTVRATESLLARARSKARRQHEEGEVRDA
ncbi:MAG: RNA polymerase sigma factor [Actinomycetota bacterium]|nr:RNA polymerase sigma factor [Actinomycetota bacterium]